MSTVVEGIAHPRLRQLYQYWLEKRGGRSMPSRADIDPLDLRFAMGNIILSDVIQGEPLRFRIRVHGTNLSARGDLDLSGKILDEAPANEFRALTQRSFTQVATTKQPFHAHRNRILDDRARCYETLILPLSSDDERADMILLGQYYDDEKR
ncbi:MAG TPA: PAS domain-containing protein [Stellaceae bacterium]|nr:PAS domain-containing protein [Stellaceae bacterium]